MTSYKGYFAHIESDTVSNDSFRHVLYTGAYSQ